jgi:putative membrane protein
MFTNLLGDRSFLLPLIASVVFAVVGIAAFAAAFVVMTKVIPFSVRKEIEEDHNTALAIVMGSVIIGLAVIVGMAIRG